MGEADEERAVSVAAQEMPPTRSYSVSRADRVLVKHFGRSLLHPGIGAVNR